MMFPAVPAVPAVSNLSNALRAHLKVADTLKDWAMMSSSRTVKAPEPGAARPNCHSVARFELVYAGACRRSGCRSVATKGACRKWSRISLSSRAW